MSDAAASSSPSNRPSLRQRSGGYNALMIIGFVLLAAWGVWWWENFAAGNLQMRWWSWIPSRLALGFDFLHNYLGTRDFLAGNDPYTHLWGDPTGIPYNYAPVVLAMFLWCGMVELVPAVIGWACAVALMVAAATWYAARLRPRLGISPLPMTFALAAMMLATATMFSMERGNCDCLSLLALLGGVIALNKRSRTGDIIAGICFALATLIKIYPGLAILGLLPLRRTRAFVLSCVAGLLISAITPRLTLEWMHNIHADAVRHQVPLCTYVHTISGCWRYLFDHDGLRFLLHIPPLVGTGIVLLPLFILTGVAIYRSDRHELLAYPYLLWLTQAASFWSPVSYDYKLLFLPLVIICLWERRSPWYAHVLLAPFLLYWQPFRVPCLGPILLLIIKFAALVGTGVLVHHAARQRPTPSIPGPA